MNKTEPETGKVVLMKKSSGPIAVKGDVELVDENGMPIDHPVRFSLCGCGFSKKLPFCDGSHKDEYTPPSQ